MPVQQWQEVKEVLSPNIGGRPSATSPGQVYAEVAELGALSNSVLDLIRDHHFDEAERVCQRLVTEYPDQVDGLDRLAMTYAAQGWKGKAAEYYRKTTALMRLYDGFDGPGIANAMREAERLDAEQSDAVHDGQI